MPDDLHDDDLGEDDPSDSNVVKQLRRQAREAKARARDLETQAAEAEAAKRELMFARAGVPLDDPKAGYFVRGYNGDADTAAVKAAWSDFAGVTPQVDSQASADIAAADRISKASTGATTEEANEQAKYMAELEALKHNGIRDPVILQKMATEIMLKYGSQLKGYQ